MERVGQDQLSSPDAVVRIAFQNLPPDSRTKLDAAVRSWVDWHCQRYLPGYVPPEVVSGTLTYHPGSMQLAEGSYVWEDKPGVPEKNGAETMWFNVTYERAGDVPQYDRCTNDMLHYSIRKRGADSVLLLCTNESDRSGKPVKRLRSSNRCFNCGSYGHSMRECWKPHNPELVEEAKRERAESQEASGTGPRSAARRYFLGRADVGGGGGGGAGGANGVAGGRWGGGSPAASIAEFADLQPGSLSSELRGALGIGPLSPPPWLLRMRALGLPPAYMAPAGGMVAKGEGSCSGTPAAAEAVETHGGSAPAAVAQALAATEAAQPLAHQALEEAKVPAGGGDSAAPAGTTLDDFLPLDATTVAAAAAANGSTDGATAEAEGVILDMQQAPDECGSSGGAARQELVCRVQFPGINAPPPEGAEEEEWGQRLAGTLQPLQQTPLSTHEMGGGGYGRLAQPLQGLHLQAHQAQQQQQGWAGAASPAPSSAWNAQSGGVGMYSVWRSGAAAQQGGAPATQPGWQGGAAVQQTWQVGAPVHQPQGVDASVLTWHSGQALWQQQHQAAAAAHHQQQQAGYHQQQQSQHVNQLAPVHQAADVFTVSRADPGHLLVFNQQQHGQQQLHLAQHHQPYPQHSWQR